MQYPTSTKRREGKKGVPGICSYADDYQLCVMLGSQRRLCSILSLPQVRMGGGSCFVHYDGRRNPGIITMGMLARRLMD
ncbi:hypothetical protein ACTJJM_07400 [Stenotrophomonas sp. 22692]|uniref:hypothetical protein n=1 Tax=Stenotrophomonas sp. 22692 TaxID=3453956 RepID=UPI003F870602